MNYTWKTTVRADGLEVSTSRTGFIRMIVIHALVLAQLLFRYSQTGEIVNLRKRTSKSVLYEQCLEVPAIANFEKSYPKLDHKSSVRVIAKSEKMRIKNITPTPSNFCVPPFVFSH